MNEEQLRGQWRDFCELRFPDKYQAADWWLRKLLQAELNWLTAQIEMGEKMLALVKKADHDIRKADKTPKYEYSRNRCDANRDGEFPEGVGTRWAMPWEISKDLVADVQNFLTPLIERKKEVEILLGKGKEIISK